MQMKRIWSYMTDGRTPRLHVAAGLKAAIRLKQSAPAECAMRIWTPFISWAHAKTMIGIRAVFWVKEDNDPQTIDLYPLEFKVTGKEPPFYGRNWPLGILFPMPGHSAFCGR